MDEMQEYFPTKALRYAEKKMSALLYKEEERLEKLGSVSSQNLKSEIPNIIKFTEEYEHCFSLYLDAALAQHQNKIQCKAGCGNCCHHYPMSIEPFEQITFYAKYRKSDSFFSALEACLFRSRLFHSLYNQDIEPSSDAEEQILHQYFAKETDCPFLNNARSCSVYDFRPATCRMYFSETSEEFCTAAYLQTKWNRSFIIYLPDYIEEAIANVSAFYESLELSESLYTGFVQLNGMDGEFFE